ncbi:MAG: hypothetical protein ACQEXJ_06430, partial [Myxococcota bacterium]
DGSTDEDYAPVDTTCGTGACASGGVTSCEGGEVVDSCTPGSASDGDSTCDGVDDDCDGSTDEDYAPVDTTCGTGACASGGVTSCEGGEVVDSCTPGQPDCSGKVCGPDGCGGSCGTCSSGLTCDETGQCVCVPDCSGKQCGGDGCGGSCGTCEEPAEWCLEASCTTSGTCDTTVVSGACWIDGQCAEMGQTHPESPCLACDPATDPEGWTAEEDFAACDDGSAATVGDWCYAGACGGFEVQAQPPVSESSDEVYTQGTAALGAGAQAAFEAWGGEVVMVDNFVATLQGSQSTLGFPGGDWALGERVAAFGDNLYERVDGAWTIQQKEGTLGAAWPGATEIPPSWSAVGQDFPVTGAPNITVGAGRTGDGKGLAIRYCLQSPDDCGEPCPWACMDDPVPGLAPEYPAAVTFFEGAPLVAANYGSDDSPEGVDVLRRDPAEGAWYVGLQVPTHGRPLRAFTSVGGGAEKGALPATLVGAGDEGLLFVSDGTDAVHIELPGFEPQFMTSFTDVVEFDGRVFVLGSYPGPKEEVIHILAHAPVHPEKLAEPAAWRIHQLFYPYEGETTAITSLGADSRRLFAFGGQTPSLEMPLQRTVWRWEIPAETATFYEPFDYHEVPEAWQVIDQCEADPASNWVIDHEGSSPAAAELGNCHDVEGDETVVEKRGTSLLGLESWFGEGILRFRVRAVDDDGFGIQYGFQDPQTWYRFSMDRERSYARLVRSVEGEFAVLAEDLAYRPPLNTWLDVAIVRTGELHQVYVDGELVSQAVDGTLPGGPVALYAWGMEGVLFDDVAVYPQK